MATYQSQYTGAQIDAGIAKAFQADNAINGATVQIPFVETGTGYIQSGGALSYTAGSYGNNQIMVINDLSLAGLAIGDKMKVTVGRSTGFMYAVGFSTTQITGTCSLFDAVAFESEEAVQTLEFIIPDGTVAIAIFNRKPACANPTITTFGESLKGDVAKIENDIETIQQEIATIESKKYISCVKKPFDFSSKTANFFGDSITYGYIAASGDVPAHQATNQYPKVFSESVGLTYTNNGVSGSTLSVVSGYSSILTKIQGTTLNSDFVFIAGGVNDWQLGVNQSDLETGVENICAYLDSNYSGEVIFITPINEAGKATTNPPTQTLQNVRNVITRIALKHGYSVVQGSEFPFPTESDEADYISLMFQDKLHPTELGYSMYAQALRNAVC